MVKVFSIFSLCSLSKFLLDMRQITGKHGEKYENEKYEKDDHLVTDAV